MAKRRVSFKLEPGECEALKALARERRLTVSSTVRELIRQGLGMTGTPIEGLFHELAIIKKQSRRSQIAAYRAYAGMVELIRFIAREDETAEEILEAWSRNRVRPYLRKATGGIINEKDRCIQGP